MCNLLLIFKLFFSFKVLLLFRKKTPRGHRSNMVQHAPLDLKSPPTRPRTAPKQAQRYACSNNECGFEEYARENDEKKYNYKRYENVTSLAEDTTADSTLKMFHVRI